MYLARHAHNTAFRLQLYHVEFYDVRDAANAYRALHDRTFMGVRLRLFKSGVQVERSQPTSPYQQHHSPSQTVYTPGSTLANDTPRSAQIDRELRWTEGASGVSQSR